MTHATLNADEAATEIADIAMTINGRREVIVTLDGTRYIGDIQKVDVDNGEHETDYEVHIRTDNSRDIKLRSRGDGFGYYDATAAIHEDSTRHPERTEDNISRIEVLN